MLFFNRVERLPLIADWSLRITLFEDLLLVILNQFIQTIRRKHERLETPRMLAQAANSLVLKARILASVHYLIDKLRMWECHDVFPYQYLYSS